MTGLDNLRHKPLKIGDISVANRVLLAPMSGITDAPFRRLAATLGAGLVVSEMTASDDLVHGRPMSVLRCEAAGIGPHVVQLAGCQTHWMAEGARVAEAGGADIIDINMGCPARHVTGGQSGSALMRDLDHALKLIEATIAAVKVPVTLKMRLGWDERSMNAPELARRAEGAGVRMITVHGRTRCQFYSGTADWAAIRAVRAAITIPLIANGDLTRPEDMGEMLRLSGADGVMIGRGACGRPWLPGAMAAFAATGTMPAAPTGAALADLVEWHYDGLLAHYGAAIGPRAARKHLAWYIDGAGAAPPPAVRTAILTGEDPKAVMRLVRAALTAHPLRSAA